jgi:hypothetical protein
LTNFNENLSAFFLANEASATDDLADEVASNDFAVTTTVATQSGKFDGSRGPPSGNRFLLTPIPTGLLMCDGKAHSFTWAFWVYLNSNSGNTYAIDATNSLGKVNIEYANTPKRWDWRIINGSAKSVSASWGTTGVWHLVVCGYDKDADVMWISVNGAARSELSLVGFTPPTQLAADTFAIHFTTNCHLDHIGFWKDWAWSNAEIAEYYNSGSGTAWPFPGPIETGVSPGAFCLTDPTPLFGRSLEVDGHLLAEHLSLGDAVYTVIYREKDLP